MILSHQMVKKAKKNIFNEVTWEVIETSCIRM